VIFTHYLTLRRSLGYKREGSEKLLNNFVAFLEAKCARTITVKLAMEWALLPKNVQPSHWSKRLSVVRLFTQYLLAYIPETEVPEPSLLHARTKRMEPT